MSTVARTWIREPGTEDAEQFARRVSRLAGWYLVLCLGSCIGIGMAVWKAQLYVALAEVTNVEPLTLGFFLILFVYFVVLSVPGAWAGLRIRYYRMLRAAGTDPAVIERHKVAALGTAKNRPAVAALNVALERDGAPGQPLEIAVGDRGGSMGRIVVDGVKLTHYETHGEGSDALLAYFVRRVNDVLARRQAATGVAIATWYRLDDDITEKHINKVAFLRNLERHLQADELWPKRTLTAADCAELERQLAAICPALRDASFLPHWTYAGLHSIPLTPWPIDIFGVKRRESRVDPLAATGTAALIVLIITFMLIMIVAFPPWVPG